MIKVKTGVTPRHLIIAAAAANVGEAMALTVTITSGTDGVHRQGSKHYSGEALDFRLLGAQTSEFIARLQRRLGAAYQIIREADHVHVEYDPAGKKP